MQYDLARWAQEAREATGMTQEDFALALGYATKASVNAIEKGRNNPTFETMVKISELSGVPLPYQDVSAKGRPSEGFIRYNVLNITAKLGSGIINPDYLEVVDTVTVAEAWARQNLGSGYRKIQVVSTKGDSMSGTIEEGDVLFVDVDFNHYAGEGIYIILTPDGLRAKRLQLLLNGDLKVISDNKAYETEIISGQDLESVVICGKVKGRWTLETF